MDDKDSAFLKAVRKVEDICIVIPMAIIIILVLTNVALRYIFKTGFLWSDEIVGYAFVLVGMIGSAIAVHNDSHTYLDAFVLRLPRKFNTALYIFNQIVIGLMLLFFTIAGLKLTVETLYQYSPMNRTPMCIPYSFIPIGTGLMLFEQIMFVKKRYKNKKLYWEEQVWDE